jgi:predicted ATPase
VQRDIYGKLETNKMNRLPIQISAATIPEGVSILSGLKQHNILDWQFVSLDPNSMGEPVPQKRTRGGTRLAKNGSNIADYLSSMLETDPSIVSGIVETLQFVMPYADDIQPVLTSEFERSVYLQMTEAGFKVPGWLLSTGTMRVLALLALLRHPSPPPVILIEEIENGLDPSTVHLIVQEIKNAVGEGRTQVIATSHSPYLLDQLELSDIVVVDRFDDGPAFTRPNEAELKEWAQRFRPGKLYTMSRLGRREPA